MGAVVVVWLMCLMAAFPLCFFDKLLNYSSTSSRTTMYTCTLGGPKR